MTLFIPLRRMGGDMMKGVLLCMICAVSLLALNQSSVPKDIHAKGCVRRGVEAGCLLVITFDGKTIYNILTGKDRPQVDDVIEFWGKEFQGATICMQGKPVKVEKWTRLDMKCPNPSAPDR